MSGGADAELTVRRVDRRVLLQLLRWVLIAVVAFAGLFTVLVSGRHASEADFRDALAAGEVTETTIGRLRLLEGTMGMTTAADDLIEWKTGPWPWQRYVSDEFEVSEAVRLSDRSGVPLRFQRADWVGVTGQIAILLVVVTIVFGPQPRGFTKWAAFWVTCLPLGIGAVWLLIKEAPWSRTAMSVPEPLPHAKQKRTEVGDSRRTGNFTFLVVLVAGTLIDLILAIT